MKEQLIEYKTAELAKEKGLIGFLTYTFYNTEGELIENEAFYKNG
jgi:hypothetical protein